MNNSSVNMGLACIFLLFSQTVFSANSDDADPINVVTGLSYEVSSQEFKIAGKRFIPDFISLDWKIAASYRNYFSALTYNASIKDYFQIDNTLNVDGSGNIENTPAIFSREDSSITFGYNFTNNFSVFGGYKYGKTNSIRFSNLKDFDNNPPAGTFPGGAISLANNNTSFSLTEDGLFIGSSFIFSVSDSGSISLGVAYADLDGEFLFNSVELDTNGDKSIFVSDLIIGDTSGTSFAVTWSDKFSDSINYNILLKLVKYQFDAPPNSDGDDFSTDIDFRIFSIGILKYF